LRDHPSAVVVALGREGKKQLDIDAAKFPRTVEIVAKMQADEGQRACQRRKWIGEPPNGWIKNMLGCRQFSMRGQGATLHSRCSNASASWCAYGMSLRNKPSASSAKSFHNVM
jgi:hypothetical protein